MHVKQVTPRAGVGRKPSFNQADETPDLVAWHGYLKTILPQLGENELVMWDSPCFLFLCALQVKGSSLGNTKSILGIFSFFSNLRRFSESYFVFGLAMELIENRAVNLSRVLYVNDA